MGAVLFGIAAAIALDAFAEVVYTFDYAIGTVTDCRCDFSDPSSYLIPPP